MKKTSILFILLLMLSIDAFSQKVAYAVLKDSTLTFYYDDKKPEGAYDVENLVKNKYDVDAKEWFPEHHHILTAVFDKSFKKFRPKSCNSWFENCQNITSIIGIKENLNTSEVTDMSSMFYGCMELTSLDVSGFNTDNVTDMAYMFSECKNLTSLDLSAFNTENVTDMAWMFRDCVNLSSLNVSGFKTDKVTDMCFMFNGCSSLTTIDLSKFNTENVTDMGFMFNVCRSLTSLDVSGFNTDKVTYLDRMFYYCENLKTIYVGAGWNTSNVTESEDMFEKCYNLVGGQGTKYDKSHTGLEYAHIDGGSDNPGYFTKK